MQEVHLIHEDESAIRFAHRPMGGVIVAAIGAGIAWIVWLKGSDSTGRWIGLFAGSFFALIGIGAAFWRYEFSLDLLSRTYTRRKGFWPAPTQDQGTFSDIEYVSIAIEYQSSSKSSSESANWVVGVKLRGDGRPICVSQDISEEKGYQRFEDLAKKLRVNAVDRTETPEKVTPWDQLDTPLASRGAPDAKAFATVPFTISTLPPGSRLEFENLPGARTIRLPGPGVSFIGVFLLLFGLAFFSGGAYFFWAKSTGMPIKESSPGIGWVVSIVFALVGLGVAWMGLFAMATREVVVEEPGAIVFSYVGLGRAWLPRRIEKREIEEVSRKEARLQSGGGTTVRLGSVSVPMRGRTREPRVEVVVRSDKKIVRLGGDLSSAEREWLHQALTVMAGN